jgi:hypothetical protein
VGIARALHFAAPTQNPLHALLAAFLDDEIREKNNAVNNHSDYGVAPRKTVFAI